MVVAGKVDVLPLEWREVGECLAGYDLAGLADRGNRSLQVDGVPEHDGGDHQIQTTGVMALVSMPTKASRKSVG